MFQTLEGHKYFANYPNYLVKITITIQNYKVMLATTQNWSTREM